jgi:hypothetical protein
MSRQQPIDWHADKFSPHPMLFHVKLTWKYSDDAWFTTPPMGWNQLCFIIHKLTLAFPHLKDSDV